jgi:acyl-coenzyme A thioesterase PaaI-like protein
VNSLQPNSRSCFVCGMDNHFGLKARFYQDGPGEIHADYTFPDHYQGYPGVVHGGVVAAILDETIGRVLIGVDPSHSRFLYTARLNVRYRKNVPTSQPIRIIGHLEKERSTFLTARAEIIDLRGEILAQADGVLVDVPSAVIAKSDLEALGWRVYDDVEEYSGDL